MGSFPSHQVVLGEVNLTSPPHPLTSGCVGVSLQTYDVTDGEESQTEIFFSGVALIPSNFLGCQICFVQMQVYLPEDARHLSVLFVQLLLPSDQGHDLSTLVLVLLLPTPQKFRMWTWMLHLFLKKSAQIWLILSIRRGPPIICQVQQGISHARQVELSEQRQREELLGRITVPWMSPNWKCSFLIDSQ